MAELIRRPAGIGLIAWGWIVTGAIMVIGALPFSQSTGGGDGFAVPSSVRMMLDPQMIHWAKAFLQGVMNRLPVWTQWLDGGGGIGALVTGAVGIGALAAGIGLLKLRPWGRYGCLILSWMGIAYGLLLGAAWHELWLALNAELQTRQMTAALDVLEIEMRVVGVVLVVAVIAPLIWMIYYLHTGKIRRLFSNPARASDQTGI